MVRPGSAHSHSSAEPNCSSTTTAEDVSSAQRVSSGHNNRKSARVMPATKKQRRAQLKMEAVLAQLQNLVPQPAGDENHQPPPQQPPHNRQAELALLQQVIDHIWRLRDQLNRQPEENPENPEESSGGSSGAVSPTPATSPVPPPKSPELDQLASRMLNMHWHQSANQTC